MSRSRSRSRLSTEQDRVKAEQGLSGRMLPRGQQPRTPSENIEAAVVPGMGNATLTPGDALGSVKPQQWRAQRQVLEPYSY